MAGINEGVNKEPLSFQRGVEKKETNKLLQINLRKRINEIVNFRENLKTQLEKISDSVERQALRDQLEALAKHILAGAEFVGTSKFDEIQAFLDVDYRNLK